MMKKFALLLALSVLPLSCVIRNDREYYAGVQTRGEADFIVEHYVSSPAMVLNILLECSDYINASEEERKDDRFKSMRENLFFADGGRYRFEPGQELSFTAGNLPLGTKGGRYEARFRDQTGYSDKDSCVFECLEDGRKWKVTRGDGVCTNFGYVADSTCQVSLSGKRKSFDGYDLSFVLDEGFTVGVGRSRLPVLRGVMRHTVSEGSELMLTCVSTWDGKGKNDVITININ